MPTLFISYKRKTTAVGAIIEKLEERQYYVWWDREGILLGDTSWRKRIDQALRQCDGVILCLTPAACASENVQYEVQQARQLGKLIFPIIVEKIDEIGQALSQIGLPPEQHVEDFTTVEDWQSNWDRLYRSLEAHELRVTRHDLRRQRATAVYAHHQTYLRQLADQVGWLNLGQINPDNRQGVELERLYIDSPVDLSLSVELQDWHMVDWWLTSQTVTDGAQMGAARSPIGWGNRAKRQRPEAYGFEAAPFAALLNQLDGQIQAYRQANPEAKPEDSSWRNSWNNGEHEHALPLQLVHMAPAHDRLVILGGPGSGKSTFVKYLALCLAGAGIDSWSRSANLSSLPNWPHGPLTPVYVELSRFVRSAHFPDDTETAVTASHLWNYIEQELLGNDLAAYAAQLRADLQEGHALLLLDGLDEVPYPENKLPERRQQLIGLVSSLNNVYGRSRIIVTSRPYAYQGWVLPNFSTVTIAPFDDNHRITLASRLYHASGLDQATAVQTAEALNQALAKVASDLKDRPLFVTLMATLYRQEGKEGLPTRPGTLYRDSILLLLDRWTSSKPHAPSLIEILGDRGGEDLYARLASLAYEVHMSHGHKKEAAKIDAGVIFNHFSKLGWQKAAQLIPYLSANAGVLLSLGQEQEKEMFRFAHRTFQEYLAADYLVQQCRKADSFELVRDHMAGDPQLWRQPAILLADILADSQRRGELWELLEDLLGNQTVVDEGEIDEGQAWCVWLAATFLQEQEMVARSKLYLSEKAICDALRRLLVRLIQSKSPTVPAVERAFCGRALALLGDPRPGVGIVERDGVKLPDIEWVEIPAGEFSYQKGKMSLDYSYWIARYPVTYAQFQTFVEDPDGYGNGQRWFAGLAADEEAQQLAEQTFKYGNHPRENVNWYQAIAFCRWLSWRLGGEYGLDKVGEWLVRLPTEFEWEKAARGETGGTYPYGNEFVATNGNTWETGIGQTCVVGLFPAGDAPHWQQPIADLSGNVEEWCLSNYHEPQIEAGKEDLRSNAWRVLHGGSWILYQVNARAVYRNGFRPDYRVDDVGFRPLLRRAPSTITGHWFRGGKR